MSENNCPTCQPQDKFGKNRMKVHHRTGERNTAPRDTGERRGEAGRHEREERKISGVDSKASGLKERSSAPDKRQYCSKKHSSDASKGPRSEVHPKPHRYQNVGSSRSDKTGQSRHDQGQDDWYDHEPGSESSHSTSVSQQPGNLHQQPHVESDPQPTVRRSNGSDAQGNEDTSKTIPKPSERSEETLPNSSPPSANGALRHGDIVRRSSYSGPKSSCKQKCGSSKGAPDKKQYSQPITPLGDGATFAQPRGSADSAVDIGQDYEPDFKDSILENQGSSNDLNSEHGDDGASGDESEAGDDEEPKFGT